MKWEEFKLIIQAYMAWPTITPTWDLKTLELSTF